jgi:hypothetical protein
LRVIYTTPSFLNLGAAPRGPTAVILIPSVGGDPAAVDYLALFDLNVRRLSQSAGS